MKAYSAQLNKLYSDEQLYFDRYDADAIRTILDTQHQIIDDTKKNYYKQLFQIMLIIDDFADDPTFIRQSTTHHSLYARGRGDIISTITAAPKTRDPPRN